MPAKVAAGVIIAVGVIGAVLAAYQFVYLLWVRRGVHRQLEDVDQPVADNPLGRVLLAFRGDHGRIEEQAEVAELRISEAVLREIPALERFQAFRGVMEIRDGFVQPLAG